MCLRLFKDWTKHMAVRNIVCYKFMREITMDVGDGEKHKEITIAICSPYMQYEYELGKEYESKLINDAGRVEEGFHSFPNFIDCWNEMESFINTSYKPWRNKNLYVYKCIIPENSFYYNGDYCGVKSMASDRIIIVEKCKLTWFKKLKIILNEIF